VIARVARFEGTAEQLEQAARAVREEVDPRNAETPGFVESLFLVDGDGGQALLVAVWTDANAIERAERQAQANGRQGALEATGGRRSGVEVYEVESLVRGGAVS
jgi:heme-degrading monooxygenase HmoA